MPRYKLFLCHTPIKPDLLGFSGIGVFACGLCDHVITRFTSFVFLLLLFSLCLGLVNILWVYCKWIEISPQVLGPLGFLVQRLGFLVQSRLRSDPGKPK